MSIIFQLYFYENSMVDNKRSRPKMALGLIAECYVFSIHVNQVDFLRKKFGVSAISRDRLVAE